MEPALRMFMTSHCKGLFGIERGTLRWVRFPGEQVQGSTGERRFSTVIVRGKVIDKRDDGFASSSSPRIRMRFSGNQARGVYSNHLAPVPGAAGSLSLSLLVLRCTAKPSPCKPQVQSHRRY